MAGSNFGRGKNPEKLTLAIAIRYYNKCYSASYFGNEQGAAIFQSNEKSKKR